MPLRAIGFCGLLSIWSSPMLGQGVAESSTATFHELDPPVIVGALDSPPAETIGKIQDLVLLPDGRTLILDAYYHHVKVFGEDGKWIANIGRGGRGPSELYHAASISTSPLDGLTWILDRGNLRLSRLDVSGAGYSLTAIARLDRPALDACLMPEGIVLVLEDGTSNLHLYSLDDEEVVRSWGTPVQVSEMPDERRRRSAESVMGATLAHCDPQRGLVYSVSSLAGTVQASRTDGEVAWTIALEGFKHLQVVAIERGGMAGYTFESDSPDGRNHSIDRVLTIGDLLVVQATEMDLRWNEAGWGPITTYVIDPESGDVMDRRTGVPLVGGIEGDLATVWTNGPIPGFGILPSSRLLDVIFR